MTPIEISLLIVAAAAVGLIVGYVTARFSRRQESAMERMAMQSHSQLMFFHQAGLRMSEHQVALAKADVDAKVAVAQKAEAEARAVTNQYKGMTPQMPTDSTRHRYGEAGHVRKVLEPAQT